MPGIVWAVDGVVGLEVGVLLSPIIELLLVDDVAWRFISVDKSDGGGQLFVSGEFDHGAEWGNADAAA